MPLIALPGLDLYYESHGPETGPAVVLLHGATETFGVSWPKQVPALSASFRVLGIDMRGHGRSTNPAGRLDLRTMADDVVHLLDALELQTAHVCGFSGGASTALFTAARHPNRLRSVTLISNNVERDEARHGAGFWDPARIDERDPLWRRAMRKWHAIDPDTLLSWWAEEDRIRPNFSAAELAAIHVPALVAAGDRDPVVPLEQTLRLYRGLPDARLLVLPGVGHGAPHRAPQLLNAALLAFFRNVEQTRSLEQVPSPR